MTDGYQVESTCDRQLLVMITNVVAGGMSLYHMKKGPYRRLLISLRLFAVGVVFTTKLENVQYKGKIYPCKAPDQEKIHQNL